MRVNWFGGHESARGALREAWGALLRGDGDLVDQAWDDGIWGYDSDTGQWTYEWRRLDPARELTGLL